MTKKPSHLHTADPYGHPDEVEQPRADIAGKEPVHVRDWDESSLVNAIRNCQVDIIEDELAYLLEKPYWQQPRAQEFEYSFKRVPADLVSKTLDMCRLDNVPVRRTVEVPWDEPVEAEPTLTPADRQKIYYGGLPTERLDLPHIAELLGE